MSYEKISRKMGLFTSESEDEALIQSLLDTIQDNEADFTLTFRRLCETALSSEREGSLRHLSKMLEPMTNGPRTGEFACPVKSKHLMIVFS